MEQDGFSITELMVVVVIIAILMGIALPTFLGMRRAAHDRAAQDAAVLAIKIAKTFATDDEENFSVLTTAGMNASEPSHTFIDGNVSSGGPDEISQIVADAGVGDEIFVAAVRSESGPCFYARTFAQGGTDFGKVEGADCRADDHGSVVFDPSW
jgi:type IV pilus assembly protein PilA